MSTEVELSSAGAEKPCGYQFLVAPSSMYCSWCCGYY